MNGTASKEADPLYQGILDYYANLSGLDITAHQIATRDEFKAANGIVCDNGLDAQVLSLQRRYVSEDSPANKKSIILQAITLLSPEVN